jgi:hypothetical protein
MKFVFTLYHVSLNMEVLRYYIHCNDYKNTLLVCKDWCDYLVPMRGAIMLTQKLYRDGYIDCYKNDVALMNTLFARGTLTSVKTFIRTLESKHVPSTYL